MEKGEILKTGIFSISKNIFFRDKKKSYNLDQIRFAVDKYSQFWKVLKMLSTDKELTHSHTMKPFDAPGKQAFWKHCGKRRNCS